MKPQNRKLTLAFPVIWLITPLIFVPLKSLSANPTEQAVQAAKSGTAESLRLAGEIGKKIGAIEEVNKQITGVKAEIGKLDTQILEAEADKKQPLEVQKTNLETKKTDLETNLTKLETEKTALEVQKAQNDAAQKKNAMAAKKGKAADESPFPFLPQAPQPPAQGGGDDKKEDPPPATTKNEPAAAPAQVEAPKDSQIADPLKSVKAAEKEYSSSGRGVSSNEIADPSSDPIATDVAAIKQRAAENTRDLAASAKTLKEQTSPDTEPSQGRKNIGDILSNGGETEEPAGAAVGLGGVADYLANPTRKMTANTPEDEKTIQPLPSTAYGRFRQMSGP